MNTPANTPRPLTRRGFLGGCCAAVTATGLLSALAQLRVLGAVAGDGALAAPPGDYRALVCLFLQGGNDANNLLIPYDDEGYAAYAAARGILALPRGGLLPIRPATTDGRSWALHPSLGAEQGGAVDQGFKSLFDQGRLAILGNVGTLAYPTTLQQYKARSVPLPSQLFSHNDQQVEWQSSLADRAFTTGWGGRLADLTQALNENSSISMSISLAGRNSFQVGRNVAQYNVGNSGAVTLSGLSSSTTTLAGQRSAALRDLLSSLEGGLYEAAFGQLTTEAIADSTLLSTVLSGAVPFSTVFPSTNLGQQLRMIARLIAAAPTLGLRRQVFFAQIGGFDLHDDQVIAGATETGAHANLFADLSRSLKSFDACLQELKVSEQVTLFSASDFGRTFSNNGRGSDHGWGSHHFILGGAVKGGDLYGRMPELRIGGAEDTGRGRWIPSTSVDEYSARLALWFGVSQANLPLVLPNIGRFDPYRNSLAFI